MNKKLILLILILPLFLMLSIYTSTNTVGINIKVPVSNIEVSDKNVIYLDLDSNEKHFVNYTIYPVSASNKEIIFETEQVGTQQFATLEFKDGYIIPKSVGVSKVYLTTVDGGFKDSFIVQVDSVSIKTISCSVEKTSLTVGETVKIETVISPQVVVNSNLVYSTSDSSIATVNDKGIIKAVGKGSATITVASEANPQVFDTINISVFNEDIIDLGDSEIYTYQTEGQVSVSIDTAENYQLSYAVFDSNNVALTQTVFDETKTGFTTTNGQTFFNFCFKEDFIGTVIVKVTITTDNPNREPYTTECIINKVNQITASFDNNEIISCVTGSMFALHNQLTILPSNADVRFEVELSNNNVEVQELSSKIRLKALLPGVTTVTVNVLSNAEPYQCISLTKEVVIMPISLTIAESSNTFGIENVWTVGKTEVDGSASTSKVTLLAGSTEIGSNFTENFSYLTDNEKVTVNKDGVISILDEGFSGLVNITAKFNYKGKTVESEPYTIRCVGNAVNVRSFYDLYLATEQEKVIALQVNIKDDFGKDENGNSIYNENTVKKIKTTYDLTHYKNIGKENEATVKVLINFKADVYGNGYQINAHNVAYGLDNAGKLKTDALFTGPLNFVSMSESEGSLVSVKAQDNISFAVYEGVNINNIELKSCDLQADESGNYDLTDLTYVGTTVEVLGDNVNINYSRLTNGRTVLRVFGDIDDSLKVINLNINNSVLSGAREFIIRMGSNCFVDGSKETPSPYINGDNTKTFPVQKAYETMTEEEKTEYENTYIKTFVKLKNSVLKDSGLFCIGLDSHFAGSALADGSGFLNGLIDSWYDLAKTSYGAKLTFEGDVRMYDWKDIENIDSSTLIEILGKTSYNGLNFDIKELIKELANNTEKTYLNTIAYNSGGTQYVHGGVAFFGGGKNYSVFETKDYDFYVLNGYEVKLSDVGKEELQLAAGNEPFYFMLNDSTTQGFLPEDQENMLKSAEAYSPIYKND